MVVFIINYYNSNKNCLKLTKTLQNTETCEYMLDSVNELQADDLTVYGVVGRNEAGKDQVKKSLICHAEAYLKYENIVFYTFITLSIKQK